MSSPTQSTQTKGSFHSSSQYAAAEDVQDTAMSVVGIAAMPENVAVETATSTSGALDAREYCDGIIKVSQRSISEKSAARVFTFYVTHNKTRSVPSGHVSCTTLCTTWLTDRGICDVGCWTGDRLSANMTGGR